MADADVDADVQRRLVCKALTLGLPPDAGQEKIAQMRCCGHQYPPPEG